MMPLNVSFGIFAFLPMGWLFMAFIILGEAFLMSRCLVGKGFNKRIYLSAAVANVISGAVGIAASLALNGGWWLAGRLVPLGQFPRVGYPFPAGSMGTGGLLSCRPGPFRPHRTPGEPSYAPEAISLQENLAGNSGRQCRQLCPGSGFDCSFVPIIIQTH